MDTFEFNKLAGGFLGTFLFIMVVALASDFIYDRGAPAKAGYELPAPAAAASTTGAPPPVEPLPNLLAKGSAARGEQDAAPCSTCHYFTKGAGPKVGPPLYGVVGRPVASIPGYPYSEALKSLGGTWTFDRINTFITDPRAYAPGTKMTFEGEADPQRRADILLFLRSLSDSPVPLPPPVREVPKPAAPAAPAAVVAAAAPEPSLPERLAAADPKRGEADTGVCHACHDFSKGGPIVIGPPLYGVVGRPVASVPGFEYSDALKALGGSWTFEKIDAFITDPRAYAPGTKMTFAGEPSPTRRADILAYLRTLSDHPVPLPPVPKPAPAAAAAAATPAPTPPDKPQP